MSSFRAAILQYSGTFTPTSSRLKAVDFSVPITNDYWAIAVPIKSEVDVWSFLQPFTSEVWIASIVSIPTFMMAMVTADYLYFGSFSWEPSVSFVLRIALVEHSFKVPDRNRP